MLVRHNRLQVATVTPLIWCAEHRMEDLYWYINGLFIDWLPRHRCCPYRYHWSLFPVIFEDRCLPPRVYDELIGMLAHGCVGEPMALGSLGPSRMNDSDINCIDMLTSRTSTLPYDDDKMQKMISLVEKAKGKLLHKNGIEVTDLSLRCKGW
jgi:hypothetical protein